MKKYAKMVAWVLSFQVIGGGIGWLMGHKIDDWYETLNRSALTPPDYAFGLVWPILYLMLAFAGWYIWESKKTAQLHGVKSLYIFQMILNWSWTPIFFRMHMLGASVIVIGLMIASTSALMLQLWPQEKFASVLLLPYVMWISFAFYLNLYTFMHN
jgi:tryptophan-rich sensory protein